MKNLILFFTFLIIIIYFLKKININDIIKKFLILFTTQEDFINKFIPNKFFKYNSKIYLLDTKSILENGKNPLVFNNEYEFKKFIQNIKNTDDQDFNFIKKELTKNKIEDLPRIYKIKNKDDIYTENKNYKCNKYAAKCSSLKKRILDYDPTKIFNDKEIENLNKECRKSIISNDKCNKLGKLLKESDEYKEFCRKNPDNKKCKNLNIIKHNKKLIEDNCSNIPFIEKDFDDFKKICLFEDFFKENMLSYDF